MDDRLKAIIGKLIEEKVDLRMREHEHDKSKQVSLINPSAEGSQVVHAIQDGNMYDIPDKYQSVVGATRLSQHDILSKGFQVAGTSPAAKVMKILTAMYARDPKSDLSKALEYKGDMPLIAVNLGDKTKLFELVYDDYENDGRITQWASELKSLDGDDDLSTVDLQGEEYDSDQVHEIIIYGINEGDMLGETGDRQDWLLSYTVLDTHDCALKIEKLFDLAYERLGAKEEMKASQEGLDIEPEISHTKRSI
jgi:hypothetical protein